MDSGDGVTSPSVGATMMTEDNDSQMLVEHDVLQEATAATTAASSKLFPNQIGNTGFRRTESSHSSLFVTDHQQVRFSPKDLSSNSKPFSRLKEMVSTSSSSGNPSPRSSASSSARRRIGTDDEGSFSRALNLGIGAGTEDQGRDSLEIGTHRN